ncbi:hypothetical protein EP30_05350 [Bifidobacterium sp. UTCIF-39]|uniref:hypothetical protein n=1 Tax=Bifidobacterium sp. UTCIF-39 TaxID=1465359 RepID=UPI001126822E|nr:hypothetical protein [Bifidobacterium sp. UTCIF-39]TPF96844.1 hypothetical protein EP30_05350 [Bifidobacterium sp. UTCIF-39]
MRRRVDRLAVGVGMLDHVSAVLATESEQIGRLTDLQLPIDVMHQVGRILDELRVTRDQVMLLREQAWREVSDHAQGTL